MDDDFDLLADYARTGSPAAFDTLVKRHAGLVYGAARRRVGSADLADEVTQATFIVLAKKARTVGRRHSLAAWLYRVARYAAVDALRRQSVRRTHERRAATLRPEAAMPSTDDAIAAMAPHVDAALDALPARDREAILLRFFENRTLEQIAAAQHVAASTVQRRLQTSLGRLAHELKRRGVGPAPAAMVGALVAYGLAPAPASATTGLTALATAALHTTSTGPAGLAKGTMHAMTTIKLKLVAAAAAGAVTIGLGGAAITRAIAQSTNRPVAAATAAVAPAPPARQSSAATSSQSSAAMMTADWQTVSLTFVHANPAKAQPNTNIQDSQSLRVDGGVTVTDPDHLIGFDRMQAFHVTRAVDGDGHDLTLLVEQSAGGDPWYAPLQYQPQTDPVTHQWIEKLGPQSFFATFAIRPPLPAQFSTVEGTLQALTCQKIEQIDIPLSGTTFTEVLPGVRLKFANLTGPANNQSYEIVTESPTVDHGLPGQVSARQPLPNRIVIGRYFIDRDGQSIGATRHAMGTFPNVGRSIGTLGGTSYTGKPAVALRYEIATGLHEEAVPVVLRNIDLPPLPTAAKSAAFQPAPTVITTNPAAGATDVDAVATTEVSVTFDQPMIDGNWSFVTENPATFPETTGKPNFTADRMTCVLPVRLKPGQSYVVWVNRGKFSSFMNDAKVASAPFVLRFSTKP